jgi:hypothetical protein
MFDPFHPIEDAWLRRSYHHNVETSALSTRLGVKPPMLFVGGQPLTGHRGGKHGACKSFGTSLNVSLQALDF